MRLRLSFARFLLKLGEFVQTLPVVVMRPDDLVEFSRQHYARPDLAGWADGALVDSGLTAEELDLLDALPAKTGHLMLLGVGGGREVIPLARMGFRVTGVDFVSEMVERAKENAACRGICIEGLVQEISQLEVPACSYDVIWLSSVAYSFVPTRSRRVNMLRRIAQALRPGGFFLFQFHRDTRLHHSQKVQFARRLIAACTMGNLAYEEGDMLWGNVEFIHAFASEEEVRSELVEANLSVVRFQTDRNPIRCGAVSRKNTELG
jgi:SAM-dependent methyltransferase